ncbi:hypothetical protein O2N63_05145 [Aliiroseovarius sp. KMU-50]|uniref:Uncharacterized protein n=1 Tax=Aliiroseovarius salicola TaxID=3009082 RepID=A0ABT4VYY3_9RHOB|nr:hypothetical protein [Aliiroseovarius sp. KMU-50]MDA5093470.1 hypothetical protein [Aliiroseovarius sp. KMU-50]
MMRLFQLVPMLGLACLLAGGYGMVHNQISYTVGPDYFHTFKFRQFRIPDYFPPRIGAALVGWWASWWMGVVIGLPIAFLSFGIPDRHEGWRGFVQVALIVVGLTFGLGMLSLLVDPPMAYIPVPENALDPIGFGRAAMLHNTSYLAGGFGLLVGLVIMGRKVRHARRQM